MTEIEPPHAIPLTLLLIGSGVLGLVIGSFLNVVIRRLPLILMHRWQLEDREEILTETVKNQADAPPLPHSLSLAFPPSYCFVCKHRLKAWHKIPVLSYLLLRKRCGFCHAPISKQYPAVELLTMMLSTAVVSRFGLGIESVAVLTFTWILIVLSLIDYNEKLLPDELTLGLMWSGLIVNAFGLFTDTPSAVLGAAAGYSGLWLVYKSMLFITRREGLGYGDMKMLAAIGAWCGWQHLPFIVLAASAAGIAVSAALLATGRMKKDTPTPFGPYLAAAGWLFFIYAFSYQ